MEDEYVAFPWDSPEKLQKGVTGKRMDYQTVYQGASAEIVEKKSRFIADVFPVSTEEEALEILERTKKKYWDARHHCWAYVIGEQQVQERFSDDGEPSGTAGKPILEVIRGKKLHNVLVIVTRYFGGTLLGTGGLVRAYTKASAEGLAFSTIITRITGFKLKIETDYTGIGKIQYLLGQRGISVHESEYTDKVKITVLIPEAEEKSLINAVVEAVNGRVVIEREAECCFAEINGEMVLF